MEQINNTYTAEFSHATEILVKGKLEPIYHFEILKGERVVGYIKTKDRKFVEYLYGLGLNIRQS